MGDLSRNFDSKEFACQCGCGYNTISRILVQKLQNLRNLWGFSVVVSSGCRCPSHNASVGGSRNSYHLNGMAADIVPTHPEELTDEQLKTFHSIAEDVFWHDGVIFRGDKGFIHVDVRGHKYHPNT